MRIYNRRKRAYEEASQYGGGALAFLYGKPLGRLLLGLATSPAFSRLYGRLQGSKRSTAKIEGFAKRRGIRLEDFEEGPFASFRAFFTRRFRPGARVIDMREDRLIAPADSRMLVFGIEEGLRLAIKGCAYTLPELLGTQGGLEGYAGGVCLLYRLCMEDCHRYCFIDAGTQIARRSIRGRLHTVSPLSEGFRIYAENAREISVLETAHFGRVQHIEVGALLVGKIVNREIAVFEKGEEKGYFEPGGSTIVQIFQKGRVVIDEDILAQSAKGVETAVLYGEGVGTSC